MTLTGGEILINDGNNSTVKVKFESLRTYPTAADYANGEMTVGMSVTVDSYGLPVDGLLVSFMLPGGVTLIEAALEGSYFENLDKWEYSQRGDYYRFAYISTEGTVFDGESICYLLLKCQVDPYTARTYAINPTSSTAAEDANEATFGDVSYEMSVAGGDITIENPANFLGEVNLDFGDVEVSPTESDLARGYAEVRMPVYFSADTNIDGVIFTLGTLPNGVRINDTTPVSDGNVPYIVGTLQADNRTGTGYRFLISPFYTGSLAEGTVLLYINLQVDVTENAAEYEIAPLSTSALEDINEATSGEYIVPVMNITSGKISVSGNSPRIEPQAAEYTQWGDLNLDGICSVQDIVTAARIFTGSAQFGAIGQYVSMENGVEVIHHDGIYGDPRVNANCDQIQSDFSYTGILDSELAGNKFFTIQDINGIVNIWLASSADRAELLKSLPDGKPSYWNPTSKESWQTAANEFGWDDSFLPPDFR
jgi:hypothetical protein